MVSMDKFFGNFLNTEDIKKETPATVKEVKTEMIGFDESAKEKLVAYFDELEKGLALNKINAESISDIANSREIEDWVGTKIVLYIDPNVMFGNKRVGGVRIRVPSQGIAEEA